MQRPNIPPPDIAEHGAPKEGQPQTLDRRLFIQFMAFTGPTEPGKLVAACVESGIEGALYLDAHDPRGIGIATIAEQPETFVTTVRDLLNTPAFAAMQLKPRFTMFGRTYSLGYEPDLVETLFDRPRRHMLNRNWPWAVWYPLRRSGKFAQLSKEEQTAILREHGVIGMSFGAAGYAHDIRLACHGLDTNDNDFVIGLFGPKLHPLSAIVQTMRSTQQTSLYLESLGPFFVGKALWQSDSAG